MQPFPSRGVMSKPQLAGSPSAGRASRMYLSARTEGVRHACRGNAAVHLQTRVKFMEDGGMCARVRQACVRAWERAGI